MEVYKIKIIETLSRVVEVKAESETDAFRKVEEMYKKEEEVLDYSDFEEVEFYRIK